MLTVIDEYSRECLAIEVARRLRSDDVLQVLADLSGRPSTAWRCTRPIEFPFTAENVDALYDAL